MGVGFLRRRSAVARGVCQRKQQDRQHCAHQQIQQDVLRCGAPMQRQPAQCLVERRVCRPQQRQHHRRHRDGNQRAQRRASDRPAALTAARRAQRFERCGQVPERRGQSARCKCRQRIVRRLPEHPAHPQRQQKIQQQDIAHCQQRVRKQRAAQCRQGDRDVQQRAAPPVERLAAFAVGEDPAVHQRRQHDHRNARCRPQQQFAQRNPQRGRDEQQMLFVRIGHERHGRPRRILRGGRHRRHEIRLRGGFLGQFVLFFH